MEPERRIAAQRIRELVLFFLLAYAISWLIWAPLYLPAWGITGLPVLPYHHALGGLGPAAAAMILTYRQQGGRGLRALFRSMFIPRSFGPLFVALLAPFMLALIAIGINAVVNSSPMHVHGMAISSEYPEFGVITWSAFNLFFFGWGEETGWRGFALPRLQRMHNALVSSIVLTVFWALWHWPAFLYRPGYSSMDVGGVVGWVLSLLTGSVLLTWLFNGSRGSVLVCAIFHTTIDIAFTSRAADQQVTSYMGMLITLAGVLVILVFKPRDLSRRPRMMEVGT